MLTWGILILSASINAFASFIIKINLNKKGAAPVGFSVATVKYFLSLFKSVSFISGLIAFILAPIFLSMALSRMDLSLVQPVFVGINFGLLMIFAALFLKERLTKIKILGLLTIVIGLIFLANE